MVYQLAKVSPRDLLPTVCEGDAIAFTPEDIKTAADAMSHFLRHLCAQLH